MIYVLYNPKSDNGKGKEEAEQVKKYYEGKELSFVDAFADGGYVKFLEKVTDGDVVVLCGGDGTINGFINAVPEDKLPKNLFYYATGTGNDFLRDLGKETGCEPVDLHPYVKDLPVATIKGKEYKFLNGIGYGIDGYCCEEGDRQRAAGVEKIDYTGIAIKGLLFHYKPTTATVTVDGKTRIFKKAWLAATMNGRYYGGGMNAAPQQDRLNNDTVSVMLFYGKGRIKTLMAFPSIFKGEHVLKKNVVEVIVGKEVNVKFDEPRALQLDGDTFTGVTEYSVRTKAVK